jgi:hypothetical protein
MLRRGIAHITGVLTRQRSASALPSVSR